MFKYFISLPQTLLFPLMTAERRIAELIEQERQYQNEEHLRQQPPANINCTCMSHNNTWRQMVVRWCYSIVDHINADREVVYIAIHILDRFLKSQLTKPCTKRRYHTDKKDYEAAVMTALLITLKLHGGSSSSTVCIEDILDLSKSSVTTRDVVEVGQTLVESLQWDKQLPTAARFAHAFVDMLPSSVKSDTRQALFEESVFTIELSVHDQFCSNEAPSLIAWMALENAMTSHVIPQDTIHCFRAKVSKVTGLTYDASVRRYLCSLQSTAIIDGTDSSNNSSINNNNVPATTIVSVIPPDEDDDEHLNSSFVQYSRSISYTGRHHPGIIIANKQGPAIIESDSTSSFDNNRTMSRCVSRECNIPRSKRMRAFS